MTLTPVNPIETLVTYLRAQSALSGVNIDTKHKYGEGWDALTDASIILVPSGGTVDRYAPILDLVLEVWGYAATQYAAVELWGDLVGVARATNREPVTVTGANVALVYSFQQESGPNLVWDDVVRLDVCNSMFSARLGEVAT